MQPDTSFRWPDGKRAAISLTFDDARYSQLDCGIPILDQYDAKATFYVSLRTLAERADDWKIAAANGHEIGNHTVTHPCSGNFRFARERALENYTPAQMEEELLGANRAIEELIGVTPTTFAYPCGQKFVGRGEALQSYVPLVAKYFLAGRGFRDESPNPPDFCDLAQLHGVDADNQTWEELKPWLDAALANGEWLVFAAHDVGAAHRQTFIDEALHELCAFAQDERHGLWLDTVHNIATYVAQSRR